MDQLTRERYGIESEADLRALLSEARPRPATDPVSRASAYPPAITMTDRVNGRRLLLSILAVQDAARAARRRRR